MKNQFEEGEYYHIYCRGVDKRVVFQDEFDKLRFQKLLYLCNSKSNIHLSNLFRNLGNGDEVYTVQREEPLVSIGAYCILGNHFHLLLKEITKSGISRFMQKLMTAYTMYFNKRNERKGSLFEGTFRSRHAEYDEYLKYLFSYIHLNPAQHIEVDWKKIGIKNKTGVLRYISNYGFSSMPDYLGHKRISSKILTKSEFPNYFGKSETKNEIIEWLSFDPTPDNELIP